jgi:hypothetical protein
MGRDKRLYPISEEKFTEVGLPIIEASYRGKSRPHKVSHYRAFCGILCIFYAVVVQKQKFLNNSIEDRLPVAASGGYGRKYCERRKKWRGYGLTG